MVTTKECIVKLRQENPNIKAVRISEQLDISRENVRQHLGRLNQPTNFWRPQPVCIDCGKPISSHITKRCYPCYIKSRHTTLTCDECGKIQEFTLGAARLLKKRYKRHFCSYICKGKWLGRNYGNNRKRKYYRR